MTAPATHGRRAPGRALKSLLAAPGSSPATSIPVQHAKTAAAVPR